ncbi:hypothetical protein [Mesorhizobium sp. DCY119]|uniref:hypothetical protein n=1 Tax=Mesorhizobium sp. DCY119 TaxID=2108445 RepID=UPI000ED81A29|nr:hypothetical protein [Mesorhizobium sp. DCY119]RJG45862.1 hypothetical protein D3Y55_17465 [Mesorhizobium sp. DCY119]
MALMINDPNIEQRVVAAVKNRTPNANNVRILTMQRKFLKGSLITISFDGDPDPTTGQIQSYINRVYVHGNSLDVYGHDDALMAIVGETHVSSTWEIFGNTKVVSGIIATLMTVVVMVIVGVSMYRGTEIIVPDLISSGWLIILGFYFGKMGSKED